MINVTRRHLGDFVGNIAFSRCGHDKGQIFVIVGQDQNYYYLADGKRRLVDKPKKKKFKHVQITSYLCSELVLKLKEKSYMDSDIRSAIKNYKEREEVCRRRI